MIESTIAMFGMPGGIEWVVIGVVALLLFGRRLPDVARSLGKSIVEFKKGIKDVKNNIDVREDLREAASLESQTPKQISNDEPQTQKPQQESSDADSGSESNQSESNQSESKPGVS